jgi:hypothetical protein
MQLPVQCRRASRLNGRTDHNLPCNFGPNRRDFHIVECLCNFWTRGERYVANYRRMQSRRTTATVPTNNSKVEGKTVAD